MTSDLSSDPTPAEQRRSDRLEAQLEADRIKVERGDDWSFTPQTEVDCWKGSFSGDPIELRDEMLEEIAATIDFAFNCADRDESVYSILTSAVLHAAAYISRQPCSCTEDEPCQRCMALGRYFDKRNDR